MGIVFTNYQVFEAAENEKQAALAQESDACWFASPLYSRRVMDFDLWCGHYSSLRSSILRVRDGLHT